MTSRRPSNRIRPSAPRTGTTHHHRAPPPQEPALSHVNLGKTSPAAYESMAAFDTTTIEVAAEAGLDPLLVELVKIRASQINACASCFRLHSRDAVAKGEHADRLAVLAAWWESQYFSEQEQAALIITERITNISHGDVGAHATVDVDAVLTPQEISAISWLAIVVNAWNRVAIASHYAVAPPRT